VQAQAGERVADDCAQASRHEPAARVRSERSVPQVTGLERTTNDVVDIDVADQPAALRVPDKVTALVFTGGTGEERVVTLSSVRRRYPWVL
jgi:hypothetical protein